MLEYSLNPIEGYVIERFHKLILSKCLFKIRENYLNLYFHNIIYAYGGRIENALKKIQCGTRWCFSYQPPR
jgi:hypothetical protein